MRVYCPCFWWGCECWECWVQRWECCSSLIIFYCIILCYQAILRSLYAYFMDKPLKEVPHIQVLVSIAMYVSFVWGFDWQLTSEGKIDHILYVVTFGFKAGKNSLDAGAITYYYWNSNGSDGHARKAVQAHGNQYVGQRTMQGVSQFKISIMRQLQYLFLNLALRNSEP